MLDTSVSSDNLGDEIIMDAVRKELFPILSHTYVQTVATHDGLARNSRKILRRHAFGIVGGTNILTSSLLLNSSWKISARDLGSLHDIVMMGVGWRDYQSKPSAYTAFVYRAALSKHYLHSCRDEYSSNQLRGLGFDVINTSCPTMWGLTPDVCRSVPTTKAPAVITALTSYRPNRECDIALLQLLRKRYEKLYFWAQQAEDMDYLASLGESEVSFITPSVYSFDQLLDTEDVDFVGSRLHGGIRALQKCRRTLILSVDNRAVEIGRDTGLMVVDRRDLAAIRTWIDDRAATEIRLPLAAIETWKRQFAIP